MNEVKIIVTARNDTFQEFERVRKHVAQINGDLDKLSKSLPGKLGKGPGEKAGEELRKGFQFAFGSIGEVFKAMPAEMKIAGAGAGAALGAAMLPAIGAAISGGVLAAFGAGAVAVGLKQAANDPIVQDAAGALGDSISAHMKVLSTPFNQEALVALDKASAGWQRNAVHVQRAFEAGARYVQPLVDGAMGFVDEVMPAVARAVERAKPVIDVLALGLPKLGAAVASAFDQMTAHGDESAAAIQALLDFVSMTVIAVGALVGHLTEAFHVTLKTGEMLSKWGAALVDLLPTFQFLKDYAHDAHDQFERLLAIAEGRTPGVTGAVIAMGSATDGLAQDTRRAAREVEALNKAFDDLFNRTMSVDKAAIRYQESIDALTESIKENKRNIDIGTEAGRANRQAILDVVSAIEAQRDAAIKAGGGSVAATEQANAAYNTQLELLRAQLRALKFTESQIDSLINKYNILAQPLTKRITVHVVETGARTPARGLYAQAQGGITPAMPYLGAASGMMIGGFGNMTVTGENGAEIADFPPGTNVKSHPQSRTLVADALASIGGAGGVRGGVTRIEVGAAPQIADAFVDAIVRQLTFRVSAAGGGSEGVNRVFGGM